MQDPSIAYRPVHSPWAQGEAPQSKPVRDVFEARRCFDSAPRCRCAQCERTLRYPRAMNDDVLEFGEFRFVPKARELTRRGRPVELPRRSFECLEYLIRHHQRAVHRDELVRAVFGRPNVSDAQLGQVVLRTRRALGDDGNAQRMIRTVAGYGYRWVAPIDNASAADAELAPPSTTGEPQAPQAAEGASPPTADRTPGPPGPSPPTVRASPAHARRLALPLVAAVLLALAVAAFFTLRTPPADVAREAAAPASVDMSTRATTQVAAPTVVCRCRSTACARMAGYGSARWTWSPSACASPASACHR